jgi:hypothetical protein
VHPRLAELWFIRCQTSLKSLIYRANFRNYVRVTDTGFSLRLWLNRIGTRGAESGPFLMG